MRVEICGGIASGKTTFARLIEGVGYQPVLEDFQRNPFWRSFYLNPGKYIFETEITFTLQHYYDIKEALAKYKNIICDFSSIVDLAYAKIGLTGNKLKIFESIYDEIISELGHPDLIINLICDPEIQLQRIKKRRRTTEKLISIEFLNELNKAIGNLITDISNSILVLTVDSGEENFVTNEETKSRLVSLVMDNFSL